MMFYKGLEIIAETLKKANAFFQHNEPWKKPQGPEVSICFFNIIFLILYYLVVNYTLYCI